MLSTSFSFSPIQTNFSPHTSKPLSTIPNKKPSLSIPTLSLPESRRLYASTRATDARELVAEEEEGLLLPSGLQREFIPKHVAVIMDGNVRWAMNRGYPSSLGHEAGVRSLRNVIQLCGKWGIRVLSVFAFSSDNWNRPKLEIEFLMGLFERVIVAEIDNFMREGIRVTVIGDPSKLTSSLQRLIADTEKSTKNNSKLQLIVALSYSGQYDIVQACQRIAEKVKDGLILPEEISVSLIETELETNCTEFPYPDLLIRTSGELRISNFLLWQLAYSELFFAKSLWPDFGETEFLEALLSFQQRQRRYGRRNSEINKMNHLAEE